VSGGVRIIAGDLGGRRIAVPEHGTRPMADRMRQSLFAVLEPRLHGARVLDLCAGSGAGGFEALSRGAQHACFVERSREAAGTIRDNAAALGVVERTEVRTSEARAALTALSASGERFDLVLFDPPYDDLALRDEALRALASPEAPLRPGSLVVATGRRRTAGAPAVGGTLRLVRELPFGETSIQLLERTEGAAG